MKLDQSTHEQRSPSDAFSRPFAVSAVLHGTLLTFFIIHSLIWDTPRQAHIPTLRVDLVGLPDQLKGQKNPGVTPNESELTKELDQARKEAQKIKTQKVISPPKSDEMVVSPKKKDKKESKKEEKKRLREERLQNALDRIKALSKIGDDSKGRGAPIKGNKISPGTSLSGEAREGTAAEYYDALREHLQERWELPRWLARKNLSAKVMLYIDRRGKVDQLVFTQSSGDAQYDAAVKKTIMDSQPFPTPNQQAQMLGSRGIAIHFPL